MCYVKLKLGVMVGHVCVVAVHGLHRGTEVHAVLGFQHPDPGDKVSWGTGLGLAGLD